MQQFFALSLKNDKFLGNVFIPYILDYDKNDTLQINKLVDIKDIDHFEVLQNEWTENIVKYCHDIEISSLNKKYNRNHRKVKPTVFFEKIDKQNKKLIADYIDLKMSAILKLIREHKPVLFFKEDGYGKVYKQNIIEINNQLADVKFIFERKESTLHYQLQVFHSGKLINLQSSDIHIVGNSLPAFIYKNKLVFFENENKFNGNKLKPFLIKDEIVVASRLQDVFFEKFVKEAVKNFKYELKGFALTKISTTKSAELVVDKDITNNIVVVPYFYYNNKRLPFYNKQETFVSVEKKDGNYVLKSFERDKNFEQKKISILLENGFRQNERAFVMQAQTSNKYEFTESIASKINILEKAGFIIKNNLFDKEVNYSKPKIISKFTNNYDWFDLEITVVFGQFQIPFKALKNNILNKEKEFVLPDGSIAILPEEWFSELRFYAKHTNSDNKTDINKSDYNLLANSKLISPDENVRQKLEKLEKLDKISLPKKLKAELREYQRFGFEWLYHKTQNKLGVCLADDMGLGKTLQTISVLQKFYENKHISTKQITKAKAGIQLSLFDNPLTEITETILKTSMIVVPRSLIFNWEAELRKFAPGLKFSTYYGNKRQENLKNNFGKIHILISTYGVVRQDFNFLSDFHFAYLVLDESQNIKNPASKTYQAVMKLESDYKITLTGTPLENSLSDLWSQMNFLNHNLLGNFAYFKKEYIDTIDNNYAPEIEELRKLVKPFILRRLKTEVAKELPEKIEQIIYCDTEDEQYKRYEKEKSTIRNELLNNKNNKQNAKYIEAIAVLNRLRQIVLHPKLVFDDYRAGSGKFDVIISTINNLIAQGDKFIIFSSFVKHLNLYKEYFEENNIPYSMLTGTDQNRQKIIDKYNNSNEIKPFLISLKAGGTGLNITSANYVLITDPWWNPLAEKQAIDRTHRIGQTKTVFVYKFITKNTLEEKILKMQERKLQLAESVIGDIENKQSVNFEDIKILLE